MSDLNVMAKEEQEKRRQMVSEFDILFYFTYIR